MRGSDFFAVVLVLVAQRWLALASPLLGLGVWLVIRLPRAERILKLWSRWPSRSEPLAALLFGALLLATLVAIPAVYGWTGITAFFRERPWWASAGWILGGWLALAIAANVLGILLVPLADLLRRPRPSPAEGPREGALLLLREVALGLWFALAWSGVLSVGRLLPFQIASLTLAVGLGLLALWAAARESGPGGRPAAAPRWMLIVLGLPALASTFSGSWNGLVGAVTRLPADLEVLAQPLLAGLVCLVLAALFDVLWNQSHPLLNRLALRLLREYLERDPQALLYLRLRHLAHGLPEESALRAWLEKGLLRLWQSLRRLWDLMEAVFGRPPAALIPRHISPDRFEVFLRARLEASNAEVETLSARWSAGRIRRRGRPPRGEGSLDRALRHRGELLLALYGQQLCPFGACPQRWDRDRSREIGERIDRHLQQCRRLAAVRQGPGPESPEPLLRQRLAQLYDHLGEGPLSGWLIPFRRAVFDGSKTDDLDRLRWRDELAVRLKGLPDGAALAAHGLLTEMLVARDWAGLIETCRLWTAVSGYELTRDDHRDLGEAYVQHALELPPGPLRLWACERATNCFYRARAREHLEAFRELLVELEREESHAA